MKRFSANVFPQRDTRRERMFDQRCRMLVQLRDCHTAVSPLIGSIAALRSALKPCVIRSMRSLGNYWLYYYYLFMVVVASTFQRGRRTRLQRKIENPTDGGFEYLCILLRLLDFLLYSDASFRCSALMAPLSIDLVL